MPLEHRATRVSCGDAHVLIATDNGALYSLGDGRSGQLGLEETFATAVPTRVSGLARLFVADIAAGCQHSCACTSFGNLFTWGDNSSGQLGDGSMLVRDVNSEREEETERPRPRPKRDRDTTESESDSDPSAMK